MSKKSVLKVGFDRLRKIDAAREEVSLQSAKLTTANAKLQEIVAEALRSVGAPIEGSFICMKCATVRPAPAKGKEDKGCTVCHGPKGQPQE